MLNNEKPIVLIPQEVKVTLLLLKMWRSEFYKVFMPRTYWYAPKNTL